MQPGDPSISDWNAHASAAPQPSRGSASSALRPAGSWLRGCPMGQQGAPEAIGVAPESSSSMAREQRTLNRLIHLEEGARSGPLLRRLVFRLRITWFLLRRTPRAKMLRRLGLLGFILRTAAAWLLLVLVPAQLAFELSVAFNWVRATLLLLPLAQPPAPCVSHPDTPHTLLAPGVRGWIRPRRRAPHSAIGLTISLVGPARPVAAVASLAGSQIGRLAERAETGRTARWGRWLATSVPR